MNEDLIQRVKNILKEESYSMNETWLRDCIEYFISENNNITYKEILKFVKTQWQLSDLREINNENGCLPQNLSRQKYIVLNGTYILQMDKMYDIATSKYKQLEKIRNISNANIEATEDVKPQAWEPKKKRMLILHLTDGIQDVSAIEYQTIASLNDTLLPGYKVMIIGPVKCRRGIILLERGKFKEIGGEVESLSITNALENVLARALNYPENPDPYNDKVEQIRNGEQLVANDPFEDDFEINLDEVTQMEQRNQEVDIMGSINQIQHSVRTETNLSNKRNAKLQDCISSNSSYSRDEENRKNSIIESLDADDDLLEMIDENQIIASTSCNLTKNKSTDRLKQNLVKPFRVLPKESSNDNMEDAIVVVTEEKKLMCRPGEKDITSYNDVYFPEDDFNFDDLEVCTSKENKDILLKNKEPNKQVKMETNKPFLFQSHSTSESVRQKINKANTSEASSSREDIDFQIEVGNKRSAVSPPLVSSSKMRCMEATSNQERGMKKILEFMIKKDIQEEIPIKLCDFICDVLKETINEITFKTVRGQFTTFGKLSKKNSCWQLEGTITDKTAAIDVAVASEIIERFLGFSVKEFSQQKKLAKANAELEQQLRMACRNAEQQLKRLDALLELELKPDQKAKVVNITSLTDQQREIIDKRLQALKL